MKILIATGNQGKLREIKRILSLPGILFVSPFELNFDMPEVEETGKTFAENAAIKALAYARASSMYALADDSGLEVEALGGRPGVYSARFAGPGASDEDNNQALISELRALSPSQKNLPAYDGLSSARYVAVIVLASPESVLASAEGTCEGKIVEAPRGEGGFGYDPYFVPRGYEETMAELSPEEKNDISHRGAALRRIKSDIGRLIPS